MHSRRAPAVDREIRVRRIIIAVFAAFACTCANGATATDTSRIGVDSSEARHDEPYHPLPLIAVKIAGNRITQSSVIMRELPLAIGDTLTEELLQESQERVYNIGLFNTAQVTAWSDSVRGGAVMYIIVSERWYIFPQLVLGVQDKAWTGIFSKGSKLYAGLGGVDYNFLGLNDKLDAAFAAGYDPWGDVEWDKIQLDNGQTFLLDISAATSRTTNESDTMYTRLAFDEISYNLFTNLHYRATQTLTFFLGAGYQALHLTNSNAGLTLNPDGRDDAPIVTASITYDTRDVVEYPMRGTFLQASFGQIGFGTFINYHESIIDARRYIPLASWLSLCMRSAVDLAGGGDVPVYSHVFLGLSQRIRGDWNDKREGEDLGMGSVELRFPLLAPQTYSFAASPTYVPEQFTVWKFGIYGTLFADAGIPWFRNQRLADQQWSNGTGGGLDLLFPYGIITRFEYAYGTSLGQFIFDIGASF